MSVELGNKRAVFARGYNELTCLEEGDQRRTAEKSVLDYLAMNGYDLSLDAQVYLPGEVKSVTYTDVNVFRNVELKDMEFDLTVICDRLSNRGAVLFRQFEGWGNGLIGLRDLRPDTVQDLKVNLRDPRHAKLGKFSWL